MSRKISLMPTNIVLGIIRNEKYQILVAKRPDDKPFAGLWEFPGGKIEMNETAEDALKRELFEEVGIEVKHAKPLFQHTHHYADKELQFHIWEVVAFDNEPHGKEGQIINWADKTKLSELEFPPANSEFIARIQATTCSY